MKIALIILAPLLLVIIAFGSLIFYRFSKNKKLKKTIFPFTIICEKCAYPVEDKILGVGEFINYKGNCPNCGEKIEGGYDIRS
jgi:hypothetical protein